MHTSDLALRFDERYAPTAQRFHENTDEFLEAFARAWFKMTHLGMGPIERYLGAWAPQEELLWRDPVPVADYEQVDDERIGSTHDTLDDVDDHVESSFPFRDVRGLLAVPAGEPISGLRRRQRGHRLILLLGVVMLMPLGIKHSSPCRSAPSRPCSLETA